MAIAGDGGILCGDDDLGDDVRLYGLPMPMGVDGGGRGRRSGEAMETARMRGCWPVPAPTDAVVIGGGWC